MQISTVSLEELLDQLAEAEEGERKAQGADARALLREMTTPSFEEAVEDHELAEHIAGMLTPDELQDLLVEQTPAAWKGVGTRRIAALHERCEAIRRRVLAKLRKEDWI